MEAYMIVGMALFGFGFVLGHLYGNSTAVRSLERESKAMQAALHEAQFEIMRLRGER